VKKRVIAIMMAAALVAAACEQKPKAPQVAGPQGAMAGPGTEARTAPPGAVPGQAGLPGGMAPPEAPVLGLRKGKVASTMSAAGYTYVEVAEQGKKIWVAVMGIKVKKGDEVEFPDSAPMENFHSKSLNRTFDQIIFAPAMRVNGQMQAAKAPSGPNPHAGVMAPMEPGAAPGGTMAGANPHAGMMPPMQPGAAPGGTMAGANPHAGMTAEGAAMGPTHKGKVVSTMNAAGYTYIEVEEQGKKLWVAVMETKVKKGDEVEFPDSPPMENFHSKTLNKTFDRIIFAPAIRINGKGANAG